MTPELVSLHYSPWSLKARWSLDAHGVNYRSREYLPMLGEPLLRLRAGSLTKKVSVPILFTDDGPLTDSWDIARWAAARATGAVRLIDEDTEVEIAAWNEASERLAAAGRTRTTFRVMADPAALAESVPPPLNRLGPITRATGELGARFLAWKYGFSSAEEASAVDAMRLELRALAAALGGRDTLLDRFSYADVAMALAMQFVAPSLQSVVRLGARARPHWRCDELAEEFAGLITWRDAVLERAPDGWLAD